MGWEVGEILAAVRDSKDFDCEYMGIVKLDDWYKGKVILVGDAASYSSSTDRHGTMSSLLRACILAGEAGKHYRVENVKDGLGKALKAYEDRFQLFMTQV